MNKTRIYITPFKIGTKVKFTIGKTDYKGTITKVMKPGYMFKSSDTNTLRYIVSLSDDQYMVISHSLLNFKLNG